MPPSATASSPLRQIFRHRLILPGDTAYDDARTVWNAMIDRRPAAIVRPRSAREVAAAIRVARERGWDVAIRGGGRCVSGNAVCEQGLVIDLSLMKEIAVDPAGRMVRVEAGCLLADLDRATQPYGLAVSAGIVSHLGIAGLTLGGGFGWISRRYGLTVDNLVQVEIVTADGQVRIASDTEHPDLFWAVRGGGGNFGVVTTFTFRAAPIGTHVYSGLVVHSIETALEYARFHREYVRRLPEDTTVWMLVRRAPPLPFLPREVHGKLVVIVPFVHLGTAEEGARLLRPLREFGRPLGHSAGRTPWLSWQSGFDDLNTPGWRNYWKSHHLTDLSDGVVRAVLDYMASAPGPACEVLIHHMEGKPSRIEEDATAYGHRRAPFLVNLHTRWEDPEDDAQFVAWGRAFFERTRPWARGVYVNFIGDEGDERVKDAYPGRTWTRLVAVKDRYDPENVFRINQNIPPTAPG